MTGHSSTLAMTKKEVPMHVTAHLDPALVALESDDEITIMLELEAPATDENGQERPEHTAVVVLDRSGSRAGPRLDHAKRSLTDLVDPWTTATGSGMAFAASPPAGVRRPCPAGTGR